MKTGMVYLSIYLGRWDVFVPRLTKIAICLHVRPSQYGLSFRKPR